MQRRVLFVAAIFVLLFLFQAGELRAAGPGATYEWISGSYRADIELTSNSAPDEEMYSGHFDFELRWSTHKRMLYYTHGGKHDAVDWDGNTGHATFTTKHRSEVTKTASLSFMPDRSIKVSVRIQSPRSRFKVFHDYQRHGLHSLRHTLATQLLREQTPIHLISEILGHATTASTLIYAKADTEALRGAALDTEEVRYVE